MPPLTPKQKRLLAAIDSKDFGNVAEVLSQCGPIELPGLRFELLPTGDVLLEYEPTNPKHKLIFDLIAKFTFRHGKRLIESRMGASLRVPAKPRFRMVARQPDTPILA